MRLKKNRLKIYKLYKYKVVTTTEGAKVKGYDEEFKEIKAEIWPASGRVQAEIYGEKLGYMLNMIVERTTELSERDGICIDSEEPNYRIVSIRNYTIHKLCELEKIT